MGEEAGELSGELETGVCFVVVPEGMASKLTNFKIDSKELFTISNTDSIVRQGDFVALGRA